MARGAPDYDIYKRPAIAEQSLWEDDFEAPILRWSAGRSAGGTLPVLSTTEQWKGVQSVYYTTAAVAGEWARLFKRFPLVRLGKIGIEFFLYLESKTPGYFNLFFSILDGTNLSIADLRLDSQARNASIVTPLGTFVIATRCFPNFPNTTWMPVKLVVDTVTDMYDRLFIGPQSISLSTHALIPGGLTNESYHTAILRLNGGVAGVMSAYTDNFVLSQNEP